MEDKVKDNPYTNHDLISIIIPVYNREILIRETLDSILNQTFTNWECIIVDDGSSDGTLKVLEEYSLKDKRFKHFNRPTFIEKGANSCRNYGFDLAEGVFVNWLDSDDIMDSRFLELKTNAFDNNLNAVVHRNRYANYNLTTFRDSKFNYENAQSLFYNYGLERIELQTCSFLWKKSYLNAHNLFDVNIQRYQDNEFHIRMLAFNDLKIKIVDIVLATIRGGNDDQISSQTQITTKKLFDVFYFRFQCLNLIKIGNMEVDNNYRTIVSKKALWSFYAALKSVPQINQRIGFLKKYRNQLRVVLTVGNLDLISCIRATTYIMSIVIFRLK